VSPANRKLPPAVHPAASPTDPVIAPGTGNPRPSPTAAGTRWSRLRVAGLVLGLAAVLVLGRTFGGYIPGVATRIHSYGIWGPIVFVAVYAIACVALVPASVLTLAAGAVFGLVEGTILAFIAATLGAAAAFLVARYLARDAVERRLAGNTRFVALDRALAVEGFKVIALLRLSPLFPFSFLNYALGLTRVRFGEYVLASVGMIPGTLLYVYYGKLAGDVAALAGTSPVHRGTEYYVVLGVGLAATVAVTVVIARLARRALQQATGPDAQTREMQTPSGLRPLERSE
jgi:uncharacterized membrane protein YdjX (TVP38/TMEM64 family)